MPLQLKRYANRTNWYIRGSVRGQAVFETTGTDDHAIAEACRIKRESELLHRSIFGAASSITFVEAAVSYLEAGGEARYLGKQDKATGQWSLLIGHFQKTPIGHIGQPEADEAAKKICPKSGNATRKRQVYAPLCAVLNHASAKWKVRIEKIRHPKVKPTTVKWATPEYVTTLLPHCTPNLKLFVLTIVYTGARLSEALRLRWETDLDLTTRTLTLGRTKNGEMRTAHISEALLAELKKTPEQDRKGRLFRWSHKSHVRMPLQTACKRAGLPYLTPHQLGRHTYATWLRRYAQRDLRGIMEDGGWKSINSVIRYTHVVPGETAKAVDKLPSVQIPCGEKFKPRKERRLRKKIA
jgi:hypothetical protein